ncbi:hypothetical protein ACFVTY_00570 [Streptomyces sp. NPDC058067]|uniref:hypothetical protein n=1 Tax=Streptomyces sp. NPDC058067 TaxID=3346324 RepID=UPI0036EF6268
MTPHTPGGAAPYASRRATPHAHAQAREDRIAEMLSAKKALADAVLGSGEAALTELTDRELADLVSLRRTA